MAIKADIGISPLGGLVAGEDLTGYQYRFVELQSDQANFSVWKADSASATYAPLGILQNAPSTNEEASVMVFGTSKLIVGHAGGATSPGSMLTRDTSGRGYLTTTGSLAYAIALEDSDASASSIISVMVNTMMGHLSHSAT